MLQQKADEIRAAIAGVDGVESERVSTPSSEPTIQVEVDLEKALVHGVKPGDVRRAATTLLAGIGVGSIFDQNKVFDVVVWSSPDVRKNLTDVRNLLIDTPSGGHIRLGQVADVKIVGTPNTISHDAVSRRVDVTAEVSGRDLGAVLADVRTKLAGVSFPLEYHAEVLEDVTEQQADQRDLMLIGAFAALGLFLLLQSAFGSWRLRWSVCSPSRCAWSGACSWRCWTAARSRCRRSLGLVGVAAFGVRGMIAVPSTSSDSATTGRSPGSISSPGQPTTGSSRSHHDPHHRPCPAPAPRPGSQSGLEVLRPLAGVVAGGLSARHRPAPRAAAPLPALRSRPSRRDAAGHRSPRSPARGPAASV